MNVTFRIDDIGASTKHFNQYGKRRFRLWGIPIIFPFAHVWFLKRWQPLQGWGIYDELTVSEWESFLAVFREHHIVPIIAVTASWVERDGTLTPFPQKFPQEASFLKQASEKGEVMIANHGLTHCVVGKHLPRFWSSNRRFHREFLPELPEELHRDHLLKSQQILETFFGRAITLFVPPGNVWSKKTYQALKETNIKKVMANRFMLDSEEAMEGIEFIHDKSGVIVFHDRELKLYGVPWLKRLIHIQQ